MGDAPELARSGLGQECLLNPDYRVVCAIRLQPARKRRDPGSS